MISLEKTMHRTCSLQSNQGHECHHNLPAQLPANPPQQITYLFKLDFPSPVTGKSPEEATNVVLTSSCPDSSVPV